MYRGLNAVNPVHIQASNKTHLQYNVWSLLCRLLDHGLYTKAGYRIGLQGVGMERIKVSAVLDWLQPSTVKEVQWFLGFPNCYLRTIWSFSSVAAPLTSFLKGKPKRIVFTPDAECSFN